MSCRYTIVVCVVLASLSSCINSVRAEVFVELGQSHYQKPPNGIWWQDQYPHLFDLDSLYYRLGVGETFRLSYFSLGHYGTEAIATDDEDRYFAGLCDASTCSPPNHYVTKGSVRGLALSSVFRWGPFYIEPGLTYVKQKYDLSVQFVQARSTNGGPVSDQFRLREEKKGFGYMLGLGVEYKKVTLAFNYFKNDESSQYGEYPGIDTITSLSIGYRF